MTPLDVALAYAGLGYAVFPCHVNRRGAKVPLIGAWQTDASTDPTRIAELWRSAPGACVGLAHRMTGTMALDIDAKDGRDGWKTLAARRLAGDDDPETIAFRTASGGGQRIYARPPDLAVLSGNYVEHAETPLLGPGLDLILGYSVLPTVGATPGRRWINPPSRVMPAGAPGWVADAARARADHAAAMAILPAAPTRPMPTPGSPDDAAALRYCAAALDGEIDAVRALPDGQRQNGLHVAACNVGRALARRGRMDLLGWAEDALAAAAPWAAARHERATIARGLAWGWRAGGEG